MKFERLSLEKYGAIATRNVDLSGLPGLVIIFGPNEAGKSTLLSAISDLLYGVPHTSGYGAVFGNSEIQLGATLRLADGTALSLRRRKGRTASALLDENGTPVSTGRMDALLGGTDRDRFTSLFGLNHASLRRGGEELLAADGEIGRLIVEAGGGLRALVSALKDLETEADSLFSLTRSSKRRFYPALEAFQEADKAVKAATTTREAFIKAQKAAATASQRLSDLRAAQVVARESHHRFSRLLRVAPSLRLLDEVDPELAGFVDIDALPDTLAAAITKALAARQTEQAAHAGAELSYGALQEQLEKLVISKDVIGAADHIEAVETLAIHVEKARLDRPNREMELAESLARLRVLRASIGAAEGEDLERRAPARADIAAVQSLAEKALRLQSDQVRVTNQLKEVVAALSMLGERQLERETAGYNKPAPVSGSDLSRMPSLAREIETKKQALIDATVTAEARAATLGLGAFDSLVYDPWPSLAVVQNQLNRTIAFDVEALHAKDSYTTGASRAKRAKDRIARLTKGAEPPTPSAVTAARTLRDDAWRDIRGQYLDAPDGGWTRPPAAQRNEHSTRFERARDDADQLVDRRGDEAQRLADITAAAREGSDAEAEQEVATQKLASLEERRAAEQGAWEKMWPVAFRREPDLGLLRSLTEAREQLVAQVLTLRKAQAELKQLEVDLAPLKDLLVRAEHIASIPSDDAASAVVRVQRATASLKAHDDQYGDYRRDAETIARLKGQQTTHEQEIGELHQAFQKWGVAWVAATQAIGLVGEVTPQQATEAATEWASATGVFSAIQLTQKRLQKIDADSVRLDHEVAVLKSRLRVELPDDCVEAARALKRMLAEASGRSLQRESLSPQAEKARVQRDTCAARLIAATNTLQELAQKSGCEIDGLEALALRISTRAQARARREQIVKTIVLAGDGHSIESLKQQWREQDPDTIAGELARLNEEVLHRDREIEGAIAEQQAADTPLRTFLDDNALNQLIVAREAASNEMHTIIERYAEVVMARSLLTTAIDQVREEHQNPLLARASSLFALCTRGAFAAVDTDVNDAGDPIVVGRRRSGEPVSIADMSDGTRDQLFLAFRLASIQHYNEHAEPIPLVADDVLVHFDDERGLATLEVLAEIGRETQVLLFTHHAAIPSYASALVSEGRAVVVDLSH
jgi:uncharacterized protein YhaN